MSNPIVSHYSEYALLSKIKEMGAKAKDIEVEIEKYKKEKNKEKVKELRAAIEKNREEVIAFYKENQKAIEAEAIACNEKYKNQ